MQTLLQRARASLMDTPDSVSLERARLVTEAFARHETEPTPIRRAKTFAHVLAKMHLDLASNPVFAGNVSERPRAWVLLPEYGFTVPAQAKIEHDWADGFLDGDVIPGDLRAFWQDRAFGIDAGIGHLAIDLDTVVHRGLAAAKREAEAAPGEGDAGVYRRAMIIAIDGVLHWAERYRAEAARLSASASDPAVRAALQRVAAALERVPAEPARDLFEGLQAITLVHLATALEGHGFSISLGLIDRTLAPFSVDEDAVDLYGAFLLKIASNAVWGSFSKTQAITVGGVDHGGRDQCNGHTMALLEACLQTRVPDPHVFLRWHRNISPAVKAKAAAMLADGLTMPLLVGDVQTAGGFEDAGIPPEDAWRYCVVGCNELGIPGKLCRSATGPLVNYVDLLSEVVGEGPSREFKDTDALLACMEERLRTRLEHTLPAEDGWWEHMARQVPTPFTSALMDGCVARGADLHARMTYSHGGLFERGLVNAANGLAAVDQLAFRNRTFTMAEIAQALREDFADERVHRAILSAGKWGNDEPAADQWLVRLLEMRERCVAAVREATGGRERMPCHVVRSLHWVDGLVMDATPDGRRAGEALCSSVGPEPWDAERGPTAALNSVRRIDARRFYRGGYNLNLNLPSGEPRAVEALSEAFFAGGGQELQVSVLSPELLREAMAHPERHGGLLVRIAGFTGRFVALSKREQAEMVRRAEAVAGPRKMV